MILTNIKLFFLNFFVISSNFVLDTIYVDSNTIHIKKENSRIPLLLKNTEQSTILIEPTNKILKITNI